MENRFSSFEKNQEEILEKSPEEKKEIYAEMLGDSEAVFVMDADIKKVRRGKEEVFKSTSYGDVDVHGYLAGGHSRVVAAAELAEFFPDLKIITASRYKEDDPAHAEVYAAELKRLGVPDDQIEMEKRSRSTIASLVEMVKMAKENKWEKMAILTSDYHVPRTQEMLRQLAVLAERFDLSDSEFLDVWKHFDEGKGLEVRFLSSEQILPLRDRRYQKLIEEVKKLPAYKARLEAEERGLKQLKDGTYGK